MRALVRQWQEAVEGIAEIEARIEATAKADAVALRLMSIPFVGPMISHATATAIGEGRQFASARRCGVDGPDTARAGPGR